MTNKQYKQLHLRKQWSKNCWFLLHNSCGDGGVSCFINGSAISRDAASLATWVLHAISNAR